MSAKLTGRCAVCGERIQRNGEGVPWRHQRPQPSGKPHDHVPTLTTDPFAGLTRDDVDGPYLREG